MKRMVARLLLLSTLASGAHLGLRNQGNTCYMNSLLQALHHLPEFRRAIYGIPTKPDPNASATEAVPLELQRVFYELEHAEAAGAAEVGTERLTRSFGWGGREVMVQQDVQEFARLLCDSLQAAMRAHGVTDGVAALFEGRTASLTRCTRVKFEREKEERFYDVQLQVQGCHSLHHSLRQFVREDTLNGDNKYNTRDEALGKQDAKRSVRFKRLPPVLQLHLKRFEYDMQTGGMYKLDSPFSFPTTLRLNKYLARGGRCWDGAEADGDEGDEGDGGRPPAVYTLHAVLSHAGDAGSGHYMAYVRERTPRGGGQWYEFDDTRVRKVSEDVAVKQQFGGRHGGKASNFFGLGAKPNAYMLVYVRRDLAEAEAAPGEEDAAELLRPEVRASFERALRGGGGEPAASKVAGSRVAQIPGVSLLDDDLDRLFG